MTRAEYKITFEKVWFIFARDKYYNARINVEVTRIQLTMTRRGFGMFVITAKSCAFVQRLEAVRSSCSQGWPHSLRAGHVLPKQINWMLRNVSPLQSQSITLMRRVTDTARGPQHPAAMTSVRYNSCQGQETSKLRH